MAWQGAKTEYQISVQTGTGQSGGLAVAILRYVTLALSFWLAGSVYAETQPATVTTVAKSTVYYVNAAYSGQQGGLYASIAEAASYALAINAYSSPDWTRGSSIVLCANGSTTLTTGNSLCTPATRNSDGAVLPPQGLGLASGNWFSVASTTGCISPAVASGNNCVTTSCPSNGGWSLNGSTCTRTDCSSYQTRDAATGVCGCPAGKTDTGTMCATVCPAGYHVGVPDNGQCIADCTGRQTQGADGQCKCTPSGGVISAPRAALDSACVGGCSIKWNVGLRSLDNTTVYGYVSFNGSTCTGSTVLIPANVAFVPKDTSGKAADGVTPDPLNKPENNQSPEACDAVGGSWGVYNGASKCLSTKDINTMDKLTVTKQTSTTVNPDGTSTIKTDITYKTKDPSGNVTTSTSSSTTNKDATGAVVGTGTGTTTGTGPDPSAASDLCKNNPGLDICNNRLNKEETQAKVLEALQGDGDYSPITNANGDSKKAEADAAHQTHLDNLTNGTFDSAVSSQKQTVADLIGSWWEPVPMTGCTPYTATIGGRTWTLDICPTAEKISTVSGYAMWVFLAFGVLGLFVKRGAE